LGKDNWGAIWRTFCIQRADRDEGSSLSDLRRRANPTDIGLTPSRLVYWKDVDPPALSCSSDGFLPMAAPTFDCEYAKSLSFPRPFPVRFRRPH
jgi:hypothetical protein